MKSDWENFKALGDLLHGKRVCLTGGADGFINARFMHHSEVNLRVNLHYQRQGGPCNVIYSGPGLLPTGTVKAEFIIYPGNNGVAAAWKTAAENCKAKAIRYMPIQTLGASAYGCEHDWLNSFMKELGTLPFTGILAIRHILSLPFRELLITGMDFYATDGVLPYQVGSHRVWPQVEWLRKVAQLDGRIKLDDRLKEVTKENYPREVLERANWYGVDSEHEPKHAGNTNC